MDGLHPRDDLINQLIDGHRRYLAAFSLIAAT